jgi:hypothetical protein
MRPSLCLLAAILLVSGAFAQKPSVVGFLRVDAAKYYVEEQTTHPYGTRVLAPSGMAFGFAEWRTFYHDTNPDRILKLLREFNVMVVDTPFDDSIGDLGGDKPRTAAAARKALEAYLTEGGSALVILQAVRYPGDMDQDYANLILEGLGVKMLHEGIYDKQQAFTTPIASIFQPEGFFLTENVTPGHPVTEGVKRLALPQYHNGKTPGVVTPQLSPDWQVLVRGEQTAQSYVVTREHVTDYGHVGTYPSAPPIVAVRGFGKGRVMIFSVPARSVHTNYGVPGWNMIVESAGNAAANLPSDGARLVLNGIKWLAETSQGNPNLGTFEIKPVARVQFPASVEWDSRPFPAPVQGVRGILGAKTALSEGTGTVGDYVQAAKAAGLSFIVFNESLEKMTARELEQLKADCQAACTADFYACPGVEFSDDLGNRWAIWGERIVFPQAQFNRAYGETNAQRPALKQWDGAVMHNPGQYWEYCAYAPNMLLTYKNLRAQGGHPANMWWFYRVPPYVYDGSRLVEDQFAEWLYALRDIRHLNPASYTRVTSPAQVAAAAAVCATGASNLAAAQDWLNTRCGNFGHPANPYVTGGPNVEQWAVINGQHDLPFAVRGKQRARLRFQVSSPDGIAEVKVHNCDYGVIRRFAGRGEKTLAQEFNLVHDRDHTLTLEITDTEGRQAISDKVFLWSYKMSLQRCGDNLNFLGGVGLCWHPDRNEMMNLAQMYQGPPAESLGGYDTAVPLTRQAKLGLWPIDSIMTEELKQYPLRHDNGILRKILDVVLPGNDVKICEMAMGPLVEPFDSPTRDTPARTSIPKIVEENQLFSRTHRAYYLQNRTNMYVTWDYRRAREGAENYRGGMVFHEGQVSFKRDATLAGNVPIMLFYFTGGALDGPTTMLVKDASGGPIATVLPQGERFFKTGTMAPGGYATAYPMDLSNVFYAASEFSWACVNDPATGRINQLQIGVGKAGQKVKAGETLTYRFAMATLGSLPRKVEDCIAKLQDIGASFGIGSPGNGGPANSRPLQTAPTVGAILGHDMFLNLQAQGNEAACKIGPREMIVDLPISVSGIEDNGCAAVYGTRRPWLRWVGVAEGKAWLQEDVDKGSDLWIGNVFVCDNKAVKLTLVDQGQAEGSAPFLEVHNPTDRAVRATVTSPSHCPGYGGTKLSVEVPAGATTVVEVKRR